MTIIHYPIPPHRSEAYAYLNLPEGSLPITEQYAKEVIKEGAFYEKIKDVSLANFYE